MVLRILLVSPYTIPSESMLPQLMQGDYLLVAKWPYGYGNASLPFGLSILPGRVLANQPERGDVVIFKAPPNGDKDYVKRVIGLPGETIALRDGVVFIDGKPVIQEPIDDFEHRESPSSPCLYDQFRDMRGNEGAMCRYPQFMELLPNGKSYAVMDLNKGGAGDSTEEVTVPDGHLFVLGDNRDFSADSRFPAGENGAVGLVPSDNLVGRALILFFSTDGSATWAKPTSWFDAARWDRIGMRP